MIRNLTLLVTLLCVYSFASAANYLTFTAETDSASFGIINEDNNADVQYSLDDGGTWNTLLEGEMIPLEQGAKALLRGNNPYGFSSDEDNYTHFTMTGSIAASGSVMSLIDGVGETKEIPCPHCFFELFSGCASLTQAPELPATKLSMACYKSIFIDCSNLTKAPELPAMELEMMCYDGMFWRCTSLKEAPELPATEMANGCYGGLFDGCSSLTKAPKLPATVLRDFCYVQMFIGCTSLEEAPDLPATELAINCYCEMFAGCTSLKKAPELPAMNLKKECYRGMFKRCTSLEKSPKLPATELSLAQDCYKELFAKCSNLSQITVSFTQWGGSQSWVDSVAPTGTFICPATLKEIYGKDKIPEGWNMKPNEGTGTESISSTDCTIWTENLSLFVCGAEGRIEVYDLNGKLLRSAQGRENETVRFVLPGKGTYVVKTETKSVKIFN